MLFWKYNISRWPVPDDGEGNDIIHQYITFTQVFDEQVRKYGSTRQAVLETIRICKGKDALKEYLESREKEAIDIMMDIFDQEYALKMYVESERREAAEEAAKEAAKEA